MVIITVRNGLSVALISVLYCSSMTSLLMNCIHWPLEEGYANAVWDALALLLLLGIYRDTFQVLSLALFPGILPFAAFSCILFLLSTRYLRIKFRLTSCNRLTSPFILLTDCQFLYHLQILFFKSLRIILIFFFFVFYLAIHFHVYSLFQISFLTTCHVLIRTFCGVGLSDIRF